jgi:hypothetical protein
MSRPRTPTAVLELRGAFKNHPKQARERAGEPRPTEPLGDLPKRLKPADKAAWREMQEHGFWLTSADQLNSAAAQSITRTQTVGWHIVGCGGGFITSIQESGNVGCMTCSTD